MMKSKLAIYMLLLVTLVLLITVASINYVVDPLCYYHCPRISTQESTLNLFYQIAQKIVANPDNEAIVLGSSRGESTPPQWLASQTGLKTMNLAVGGGEALTRFAFINLAKKTQKLKRVYWLADYFEITSEAADAKIKSTPALRELIIEDIGKPSIFMTLNNLAKLIDHKTFEASMAKLKSKPTFSMDLGNGSQIDPAYCTSPAFKGDKSRFVFEKDRDILYDSYSRNILSHEQSPQLWNAFKNKMEELDRAGIQVWIVPLPYNPQFLERLKNEHPEIIARHNTWLENLKTLETKNIRVANSFEGIPNDSGDEVYWNDGVHFTCRGAIDLLAPLLKN